MRQFLRKNKACFCQRHESGEIASARKPVRAGIFIEIGIKKYQSSVRSEIVGNDSVAANVSSLILKLEPTHVGCHDETNRICRSAGGRLQMVAVRKNLDSVWVWLYKDVAPIARIIPQK